MLKYHNLFDGNTLNSSIITIGNYDGIHLGHKYILEEMLFLSMEIKLPTVLLTFNPHTNDVIFNKPTPLLCSYNKKTEILNMSRLNYLCVVDFTQEISRINVDDFMKILIKKYNPKSIVLGYDNKFGYKKTGTFNYLSQNNNYKNIIIKQCNEFCIKGIPVKSSSIKKFLINGMIDKANEYLGYKYSISGIVVRGNGIGVKIGFPTANIEINENKQLIPSNGVYSVNLTFNNSKYSAICNIGTKPTISMDSDRSLEVHLIDVGNIDLYNQIVDIEFNFKIRDEVRFKNINELKNQIEKDIKLLVEGE